jgi:hypothetical protein
LISATERPGYKKRLSTTRKKQDDTQLHWLKYQVQKPAIGGVFNNAKRDLFLSGLLLAH